MPTIKQKLVAQKIMQNGGNVSKAMLEVGYSKKTAKTPQKLTNSKGFQKLMLECFLSPKEVIDYHRKLFEKTETYIYKDKKTGKIKVFDTGEIDVSAVVAALNMAYKLLGLYSSRKQKSEFEYYNNKLEHLSDEELSQRFKQAYDIWERYEKYKPARKAVVEARERAEIKLHKDN